MSEKTSIKLDQDVIIPSCGLKTAGTVISKQEAGDSYEWLLKNNMGHLVGQKTKVQVAQPVVESETTSDTEELDADDADDEEEAAADSKASDSDDESETTDDGEVVNEQTPVTSEDAAVIVAVKELLTQGKMHLKTIVQQSGFTEEVVAPLLTEANGFRKNQQGWFSNI
jgi:hypothetical protein